MRAIIIGCRETHDRDAVKVIEDWCEQNRRSLYDVELVDDHYDMSTKPRKGDAVKALRRHEDTRMVIACHIFSMDRERPKKYGDVKHQDCDGGWMYTKENHKLIDICLERRIPLFVLGDQPMSEHSNLPDYMSRTYVGTVRRFETQIYQKIFLYEKV